jgi:hypothetical protein
MITRTSGHMDYRMTAWPVIRAYAHMNDLRRTWVRGPVHAVTGTQPCA